MASAAPPSNDTGSARRGFRWVFLNRRTGHYTVAQWPNLALSVFIAAAVVGRLFHPAGTAETALRTLGVVALIGWAIDEVVRGVNPFRRALGAAVLVATVTGLALHG